MLPKNCQLYRFVCPKCCKKFRQRGSLKKHTKANACPSQPFACIYCDQWYMYYKSVIKHIRQNRCRAINNFRATHDSTVLACESGIGKEVDKHIVTFDQSPTGVQKVGGANIATSQNPPGFVERSPDSHSAKIDDNKQNTMGGYQSDSYSCTQCKKIFKR